MRQNAIYNPGDTCPLEISRGLTAAPGTLRGRILAGTVESKLESTCLLLGGKIKAMFAESANIDSVGPEPGVGYDRSLASKGQHQKKKFQGFCSGTWSAVVSPCPSGKERPKRSTSWRPVN